MFDIFDARLDRLTMLATTFLTQPSVAARTFFLEPTLGNDSWPGTYGYPVKTLQRFAQLMNSVPGSRGVLPAEGYDASAEGLTINQQISFTQDDQELTIADATSNAGTRGIISGVTIALSGRGQRTYGVGFERLIDQRGSLPVSIDLYDNKSVDLKITDRYFAGIPTGSTIRLENPNFSINQNLADIHTVICLGKLSVTGKGVLANLAFSGGGVLEFDGLSEALTPIITDSHFVCRNSRIVANIPWLGGVTPPAVQMRSAGNTALTVEIGFGTELVVNNGAAGQRSFLDIQKTGGAAALNVAISKLAAVDRDATGALASSHILTGATVSTIDAIGATGGGAVSSVNSKTGAVVLTSADVGAVPLIAGGIAGNLANVAAGGALGDSGYTANALVQAAASQASIGRQQLGTWNAATNTPTLTTTPTGLTDGSFYEVGAAGTWNGMTFVIGDRIVKGTDINSNPIWFKAALNLDGLDAKCIWVSNVTGNDAASGTPIAKKRTITAALGTVAQPGEIRLYAGVYAENISTNKQNIQLTGVGVNGSNATELQGTWLAAGARHKISNILWTHGSGAGFQWSDTTGGHQLAFIAFAGTGAAFTATPATRGWAIVQDCDFSSSSAAANIVLPNLNAGNTATLYLTRANVARLWIGTGWTVYITDCRNLQIVANAGTLIFTDLVNCNARLTSQAQINALSADTSVLTDGFYIVDFAGPSLGGRGDIWLKQSLNGIATSFLPHRPYAYCPAAMAVANVAWFKSGVGWSQQQISDYVACSRAAGNKQALGTATANAGGGGGVSVLFSNTEVPPDQLFEVLTTVVNAATFVNGIRILKNGYYRLKGRIPAMTATQASGEANFSFYRAPNGANAVPIAGLGKFMSANGVPWDWANGEAGGNTALYAGDVISMRVDWWSGVTDIGSTNAGTMQASMELEFIKAF